MSFRFSSQLLKADLLLLFAALIWGGAFVAQRAGMEHLPPIAFNGIRFVLGTIVLAPFAIISWKLYPARNSSKELFAGAVAGLILFVATNLQQIGIVSTTAGKAGFITGLYVVLVPLLGIFFKHRPQVGSLIGALLALSGLFLLTVEGDFKIGEGDLWVLACAFAFTLHVLWIAWASTRADPIRLAFLQFLTCASLSLALAFLLEQFTWEQARASYLSLLYSGVLSVGVAYTLQVFGQREARPSHAAIIMSLEAAFAALAGWAMLGEVLSLRAVIGCALMFLGMVASQWRP